MPENLMPSTVPPPCLVKGNAPPVAPASGTRPESAAKYTRAARNSVTVNMRFNHFFIRDFSIRISKLFLCLYLLPPPEAGERIEVRGL